MTNQRDPGFCGLDDLELAKIRLPPVRTERPDFNFKWFPGGHATAGNIVTPYLYGECAFDAIGAAMATVSSGDHRIYVIGWQLDTSVPMFRPAPTQAMKTFWELVVDADNAKVPVRAMLDKSLIPTAADPNGSVCTAIDGLSFGGAVHDEWKIPGSLNVNPPSGPGIHHQKLVVVVGLGGVVGFIGGMDIQKDRILVDNANKGKPIDATDPTSAIDTRPFDIPIHDVHLRAMGPITRDLRAIFVQRWNDHPDAGAHDGKGGAFTVPANDPNFNLPQGFIVPPSSHSHGTSTQLCRVGRTYPNGVAHGMSRNYRFLQGAPGEHSAWDMIQTAINQARNYIYIEDQYLISLRAAQALAAKLQNEPRFPRIIILTNPIKGIVAHDLRLSEFRRGQLIRTLRAADPTGRRWSIHVLKGSSDQAVLESRGIFVHSKLWLFDDRYAIVGSANSDERGYTHDSECVLGVAEDDIFPEPQLGFAHRLRMRLWAKHSLVPIAQLQDWRASLRIWDIPNALSMIDRYDGAADLGNAFVNGPSSGEEQILSGLVDPPGD